MPKLSTVNKSVDKNLERAVNGIRTSIGLLEQEIQADEERYNLVLDEIKNLEATLDDINANIMDNESEIKTKGKLLDSLTAVLDGSVLS